MRRRVQRIERPLHPEPDIVFGDPYALPPSTIETLSKDDLAETPLGRRALVYLALLETGDEAAIPAFVQEHFTPRVLEKYSMDELAGQFKGEANCLGGDRLQRDTIEFVLQPVLALLFGPPRGGRKLCVF